MAGPAMEDPLLAKRSGAGRTISLFSGAGQKTSGSPSVFNT